MQVTLAPQESVAFIPADQVPRAQHILRGEQGFRLTPLALKDFHRQPVYGLYCRAHRQLMNYEKRLREGGVTVYEADVRPPERYLMERFITKTPRSRSTALTLPHVSVTRLCFGSARLASNT